MPRILPLICISCVCVCVCVCDVGHVAEMCVGRSRPPPPPGTPMYVFMYIVCRSCVGVTGNSKDFQACFVSRTFTTHLIIAKQIAIKNRLRALVMLTPPR